MGRGRKRSAGEEKEEGEEEEDGGEAHGREGGRADGRTQTRGRTGEEERRRWARSYYIQYYGWEWQEKEEKGGPWEGGRGREGT